MTDTQALHHATPLPWCPAPDAPLPGLPTTHQGEHLFWGRWAPARAMARSGWGRPSRPTPCEKCAAEVRWYIDGFVGKSGPNWVYCNYCTTCGDVTLRCVRPPLIGQVRPHVEEIEPGPTAGGAR